MIGDLWDSLRNTFFVSRPTRRCRKNRDSGSALHAECLEQRELLSANQIYFQPAISAIVVEGTSSADTVNVWTDASDIVHVTMENLAGTQSTVFARSLVAQVRFIGGDGDDFFQNTSTVSSLALGEGGNDILVGGLGGSFFQGRRRGTTS